MKDKESNFADKEATERRLGLLEQEMAKRAGAERGIGVIGSIVLGAFAVMAVLVSAASFIMSKH